MMVATSRLRLELIVPGQAHKEVAHNEALAIPDGCVAPCFEQRALASPPSSPVAGRCYLVAAGASGAWSGRADQLAIATDGGWRFVVPRTGMRAWIASEDIEAVFRGGAWDYGSVRAERLVIGGNQLVGPRAAAIAAPAGGATIDAECRAVLATVLAALRTHGLVAP
jgi:hypothetical protein